MTKRVFKWWWAWKAEKIEEWLERQAAGGWILESCSLAGIVFHFRKGNPMQIRYSVDYLHKPAPDYERVLADDGWNILTMGGSWYVCCKEYDGKRPELYTDIQSLIERNNRLISVLVATGMPMVVMMPMFLKKLESEPLQIGLTIIWIPIILLYIFGMGRLLGVHRALKDKQNLSGR